MQSKIDTSFQTMQRDLFESGMVAQIGVSAFSIWQAIKSHADFATGESWPGMRRLAEMTGVSVGTVSNAIEILEKAKLLRVLAKGGGGRRGGKYVARERLDVRLGDRVLCTIVLDYIPLTFRKSLESVSQALNAPVSSPEAFAACEIIPGEGFLWDPAAGVLRASIPAAEIPGPEELDSPLARRVLEMQQRHLSTDE